MKISKKEAQAAIRVYYDSDNETAISAMRAALEAAYTVRKARKAAKRAKAKPSILDEDQQEALRQAEQPKHRFKVGDRVTYAKVGGGKVVRVDENDVNSTYLVDFDCGYRVWPKNNELSPESVKPAWNGKHEQPEPQFGIGEWMTRGGGKAVISSAASPGGWKLYGFAPNGAAACWPKNGVYDTSPRTVHDYDLVGPWTEPAKPVWNGKFEVGKAYRTRDGRKVYLTKVDDRGPQPIRGAVPHHDFLQKWYATGRYRKGAETELDLVGPWED